MYDDGLYDEDSKQLIQNYTKQIKAKQPKYAKDIQRHLEPFKQYLLNNKINLNINSKNIEEYTHWIYEQKNDSGMHHQPTWITHNIEIIRGYLNWLVQNKHLKENPISNFKKKEFCIKIKEKYNKRRLKIIKTNQQNYKEQEVMEKLFHTIQRSKNYTKDLKIIISELREYANEKTKRIIDLNEEDLKEFLNQLSLLTTLPSRIVSEHRLRKMFDPVRLIFKWLYEEGYIENNPINHWKKTDIEDVILNRTKLESKSRQYSTKEILSAYKRYLNQNISNYLQEVRQLKHILFFIRFIVSRGKSLYKVTATTIKEFKNHLLQYEYEPQQHYSIDTQTSIFNSLKRFYDWFTYHQYSNNHPLKHHSKTKYQTWL